MAKFRILNGKNVPEKELKKKAQCLVEGKKVFTDDVVDLDPASSEAKELVGRGLAAPADVESKKAFPAFKESPADVKPGESGKK